jgi:predicted AlkP superfamily phosphohydrolase/phosphomutase
MRDIAFNFNAYSGYYFAQSTKIHEDYNWDQLTKKSFKNIVEKFS